VPSKSQAAAIILKALQSQCNVVSERFNRNDGYPFDRFTEFFKETILAHPELYPRQAPQDPNAEFGGTFGETAEAIPLRFTIQAYYPGPYEVGTISYCPWYPTKVQIYDITVVGPKMAKVTYGQTEVKTKLAVQLGAIGITASSPAPVIPMAQAVFQRYDALGWQLANN
jgi:hypothetical protein